MNINDTILRITRDAYKPVNTDEIFSWARKNISLPKSYAETGPFDVMKSRYLIEPFKAIKDLKTRTVVVAAAVQTGKTLLADISIPWAICNRPGPIQFSQATDAMVKDHINNRLYPLLTNCKPLKDVVPSTDKDFTNSGIRFPHMTLYANGEKESAFQAKSIMFAICDEVHLWDRGRLPEAIARVSAFDRRGTSKCLVVSQPGEFDDDFDRAYQIGTQEEWSVPCFGCGAKFFPVWRQQRDDGSFYGMLWDSNDTTKPDDKWNYQEVLKTVRYECEFCGHKHIDSTELKKRWNDQGQYIQRNVKGDIKVRSFKWNALVKDDWSNLVIEFLQAKDLADKGIKDNLTKFFQKRITQVYNPNIHQFNGFIKTDVYPVDDQWPDAVARFMTVDCQKYGFWCLVREFAADGRSRQLYFGKEENEEGVKKIQQTFKVDNHSVFVDVANTEKQEDGNRHLVYEFVDRNLWTGLRGDHWHDDGWEWNVRGQKVRLFYSQPQWIPNTRNGRHYYNFAPNTVRDILKELRDGRGVEFKCLDNTDYKKQMFAEKRMPVKDKYGQISYKWRNMNNADNHAWDCEVMMLVASLIHPSINLIPKM